MIEDADRISIVPVSKNAREPATNRELDEVADPLVATVSTSESQRVHDSSNSAKVLLQSSDTILETMLPTPITGVQALTENKDQTPPIPGLTLLAPTMFRPDVSMTTATSEIPSLDVGQPALDVQPSLPVNVPSEHLRSLLDGTLAAQSTPTQGPRRSLNVGPEAARLEGAIHHRFNLDGADSGVDVSPRDSTDMRPRIDSGIATSLGFDTPFRAVNSVPDERSLLHMTSSTESVNRCHKTHRLSSAALNVLQRFQTHFPGSTLTVSRRSTQAHTPSSNPQRSASTESLLYARMQTREQQESLARRVGNRLSMWSFHGSEPLSGQQPVASAGDRTEERNVVAESARLGFPHCVNLFAADTSGPSLVRESPNNDAETVEDTAEETARPPGKRVRAVATLRRTSSTVWDLTKRATKPITTLEDTTTYGRMLAHRSACLDNDLIPPESAPRPSKIRVFSEKHLLRLPKAPDDPKNHRKSQDIPGSGRQELPCISQDDVGSTTFESPPATSADLTQLPTNRVPGDTLNAAHVERKPSRSLPRRMFSSLRRAKQRDQAVIPL